MSASPVARNEVRALQIVVAVLSLIPLSAGAAGAVLAVVPLLVLWQSRIAGSADAGSAGAE